MFLLAVLLLLTVSFLIQSVYLLLSVSAGYCFYYLYQDFRNFQVHRLDVSTFLPFGFLLNTLSHFIAITTSDPSKARYFLLLYKPQHLFEGLALYCVGFIIIMEAMRRYAKRDLTSVPLNSDKLNWNFIFILSAIIFVFSKLFSLTVLGSLASAIGMLVFGAVFYLSFSAHRQEGRGRVYLLLAYVASLSFYALQYSYLRYEILVPWIAYFFGELVARKKLSRFSYSSRLLGVFLLIIVPPLFTYLGAVRGKHQESDRDLSNVTRALTATDPIGGESVLSRLSYINQVTNVVGLVEKNGFYDGETLSYFAYAFIPRFLWPEKPLIKQGQWFAEEAGLAYRDKQGRVNNSINMTVPGEFYLNFGWAGVIVGCWFFGVFFAFIWNNVQGNSLASWAFRYNLLFGSMAGLGADLQVVVTLTAFFLMYQFYFWIHKHVRV